MRKRERNLEPISKHRRQDTAKETRQAKVEVLCEMVHHEKPDQPFRRWFHGVGEDGTEYVLAETEKFRAPWILKRRKAKRQGKDAAPNGAGSVGNVKRSS